MVTTRMNSNDWYTEKDMKALFGTTAAQLAKLVAEGTLATEKHEHAEMASGYKMMLVNAYKLA